MEDSHGCYSNSNWEENDGDDDDHMKRESNDDGEDELG